MQWIICTFRNITMNFPIFYVAICEIFGKTFNNSRLSISKQSLVYLDRYKSKILNTNILHFFKVLNAKIIHCFIWIESWFTYNQWKFKSWNEKHKFMTKEIGKALSLIQSKQIVYFYLFVFLLVRLSLWSSFKTKTNMVFEFRVKYKK